MLKVPVAGSNLTLNKSTSPASTPAIRTHPRRTRLSRLPLRITPTPLLHPSIQGSICRQAIRTRAAAEAGTSTTQGDAKQQADNQVEDVQAAWAYLKEFTLKTFRGLSGPYTSTAEKRAALRNALLLVFRNPWPAAGWVPPRPQQQQQHTDLLPSAPCQTAASPASTHGEGSIASSGTKNSSGGSVANSAVKSSSEGGVSGSEVSSSSNQGSAGSGGGLVMIGLMASDVRVGARAMRDYCAALGLSYSKPESRVPGVTSVAAIQGAVYMKYNSQSQLCYVSPYLGKERGVLLQLGVEQLGHFPLGLFDEAMNNPPPEL